MGSEAKTHAGTAIKRGEARRAEVGGGGEAEEEEVEERGEVEEES